MSTTLLLVVGVVLALLLTYALLRTIWLQLVRRHEVMRWVNYLKHNAEKGDHHILVARQMIGESLRRAGLELSDFNLDKSDLDKIERRAYFTTKARNLLEELKAPGKGWFYSPLSFKNPNVHLYRPEFSENILGDPLVFVNEIAKSLATVEATLADIGTSESEIKVLVRAGHLASAKFLLQELERVSNEKTYPIERAVQALKYHLQSAGITLEEIGCSRQKLEKLSTTAETV